MKKYNLKKSIQCFLLYSIINSSMKKGISYKELIKLTKKEKSTLSEQLKPLKEKKYIIKKWNKEKKDYIFISNNKKYPCPCCSKI